MRGGPDPATRARVAALFTRAREGYRFARWGRPLAPAFFGFAPDRRAAYRAALARACATAGARLGEDDPELGVNHLAFWREDWASLKAVPGLDRLIPDLAKLVSVLQATGANQYRVYGFDGDGAIRLCVVLLRADADLRAIPFETLALSQAAQSLLLWSDDAFRAETPARPAAGGGASLDPFFAGLMRAAYAAGPAAADDPDHAAVLAAAMAAGP